MWIRMAFSDDNTSADEMPTLVAAVDEYTWEAWGRQPDFYTEEVIGFRSVRELIVTIPNEAVTAAFSAPMVAGTVEAV